MKRRGNDCGDSDKYGSEQGDRRMNLLQTPEQGMMYALYTDRVVYESYSKNSLPSEEEIKKDLLELHLFDAVGEYRYIKTRKGEIEVYINDENMDYQDTYVERIYTLGKNVEKTDKNADKVEVVNYISYDENDLMVIRNYRLKEVE